MIPHFHNKLQVSLFSFPCSLKKCEFSNRSLCFPSANCDDSLIFSKAEIHIFCDSWYLPCTIISCSTLPGVLHLHRFCLLVGERKKKASESPKVYHALVARLLVSLGWNESSGVRSLGNRFVTSFHGKYILMTYHQRFSFQSVQFIFN